ncbi:MAG: hypothetical protein NTY77_03260 [Elusimicrobia bacterium]|nr:hypothetical protein [Elusimicrobiota bacterium]
MAKTGISHKRAEFWRGTEVRLRPGARVRVHDPTITLRDPDFIRAAILEALDEGDYEGVIEIYRAHLRVLNRTRTAEALKVSRQYVHKMLKHSSNIPSLRTFTAFMGLLRQEAAAR